MRLGHLVLLIWLPHISLATKFCKVCSEELGALEEDCQRPIDADCQRMIRSTSHENIRCLARLSIYLNGTRRMSKTCSSVDTLRVVLGIGPYDDVLGCGRRNEGRIQFCVCQSHNCNQGSLDYIRENVAPARALSVPLFLAPILFLVS